MNKFLRVCVFLLVLTLVFTLASCDNPREAGEDAREFADEAAGDAMDFMDGFCSAALLPFIVGGIKLFLKLFAA